VAVVSRHLDVDRVVVSKLVAMPEHDLRIDDGISLQLVVVQHDHAVQLERAVRPVHVGIARAVGPGRAAAVDLLVAARPRPTGIPVRGAFHIIRKPDSVALDDLFLDRDVVNPPPIGSTPAKGVQDEPDLDDLVAEVASQVRPRTVRIGEVRQVKRLASPAEVGLVVVQIEIGPVVGPGYG